MGKIFTTRKDAFRFTGLLAVFFLILVLIANTMSFEKEWYNLDYEDYQKDPGFYSTADAEIVDFETHTCFNDKSLALPNIYFMAVAEVTYKGGQTEKWLIPRDKSDKIGSTVSIVYPKQYDEDYEAAKKASEDPDVIGKTGRSNEVHFGRYSAILVTIEALLGIGIVLFVIFSIKKEKPSAF